VGNRAVSVFSRRMAGGLNVKDAVYYELKAPVGMNIPSFPHSTKLRKPPAPHRRHAMLQQTHHKPRMHRLYTEAMGQCHQAHRIARDYAIKPDDRARPYGSQFWETKTRSASTASALMKCMRGLSDFCQTRKSVSSHTAEYGLSPARWRTLDC
jgi:hypothetical protein